MKEKPGASLAPEQKPTRIRYRVVLLLFIASCFSYGDRVMLSITGIAFSKDLHLSVGPLWIEAHLWDKHRVLVAVRNPGGFCRVSARNRRLHCDLRTTPDLRTGSIARVPWQRAHRGELVSRV